MQKYWDAVAVGIVTLVIVSIILIIKPGYTPIEIDDEAMIAPGAAAEEAPEAEEAEVEVEEDAEAEAETEEDTEAEESADDEAEAEDAGETEDDATEEAETE